MQPDGHPASSFLGLQGSQEPLYTLLFLTLSKQYRPALDPTLRWLSIAPQKNGDVIFLFPKPLS